jgi:hypothetical protein
MASFPVRAEDAVFLHAQTARCPQQVGAVVMLNGPGVDLAGLRSSVAARVGQLPQLRRRLIPPPNRWTRPRWAIDAVVDVGARVTEVTADAGTPRSLEQVVGQYFAEPVDPCAAAWQLLLVHTGSSGPSAIVVKAHHALGDSFALIATLGGLFDPQPWGPAGSGAKGSPPGSGPRQKRRAPRGNTAITILRVARGLAGMALAVPPAPISVPGGVADGRREFTAISLDAKTAAARARPADGRPDGTGHGAPFASRDRPRRPRLRRARKPDRRCPARSAHRAYVAGRARHRGPDGPAGSPAPW